MGEIDHDVCESVVFDCCDTEREPEILPPISFAPLLSCANATCAQEINARQAMVLLILEVIIYGDKVEWIP